MGERTFSAATLDDVMRYAIQALLQDGERVNATKGSNVELRAVRLEMTNPRARLSRTETRGKPFSCLGELCWYLAGTNNVKFIEYYIGKYRESDENGIVFGGYGPRLVASRAGNQIINVSNLLRAKPESRRACIQLFDATDIADDHKDVPCTCTLQLLVREGALHMIVYMRSNDVVWGLPHDVFCFTMFQEIIATSINVDLGTYTHIAGSLHLYDETREAAESFIAEGLQPTTIQMPPMPAGDPWPAIATLVELEEVIRTAGPHLAGDLSGLDVYWADIVRLLQIYKCVKLKDLKTLAELRTSVANATYHPYIESKLRGKG
ncbi:MAG TPA: thymidylate synthase [Thermoanaerobaculia bacterium]|nr:thymidylate synthase [Thermoanaerobaculia bacterium]